MDIFLKFGKNIQRFRIAKKLTQLELAARIKADKSYISNLEKGAKNPTLSTISKISEALNVSVNDLLK